MDQTCVRSSLHQGADHGTRVEAAQVIVGLPCAHEHDGLAGDVGHGNGSAHLERKRRAQKGHKGNRKAFGGAIESFLGVNLVVDCVKLGEDDAVDEAWLVGHGVVSQRLVELHLDA